MYRYRGIFEDSVIFHYVPHTVNNILYYETEELLRPCMSESSIIAHIFCTYKMFTLSLVLSACGLFAR